MKKAKYNAVIHDPVNNPIHYNSSCAHCECGRQIECITISRNYNFSLGNVIKYIWRHDHKDGLTALLKAQWYLNDYIKEMKKCLAEKST